MTQSIGAMHTHTYTPHTYTLAHKYTSYTVIMHIKNTETPLYVLKSHPADRHEMGTTQSYIAIDITIYRSDFRLSIL